MPHLEVKTTWGLGCFWTIFMECDLVGHARAKPVGDVLKTLSLSPQHPASLPGEQRLRFPLSVEQSQPTPRHRMAELVQLQPTHCDMSPKDESAELLVDLLAETSWQGEDLSSVPDS